MVRAQALINNAFRRAPFILSRASLPQSSVSPPFLIDSPPQIIHGLEPTMLLMETQRHNDNPVLSPSPPSSQHGDGDSITACFDSFLVSNVLLFLWQIEQFEREFLSCHLP